MKRTTTEDDRRTREQYHERIVGVSQIVWEWVVPWLVVFPPHPDGGGSPPPSWLRAAVALCRAGEALFPLVPRACRSLLGRSRRSRDSLEAAAEAGAPSCLRWLLLHHPRPRHSGAEREGQGQGQVADTVRVLAGLCRGGHLGMAQRLLGEGEGAGEGGRGDVRGGVEGIGYHVRFSEMLRGVCGNGHLEVAQWMCERFGITEPWEFAWPLTDAVSAGHLEVAQWVTTECPGVVPLMKKCCRWFGIHRMAVRSGNLAVVRWCFETFPIHSGITCEAMLNYVDGKSESYREICQFIKDHTTAPCSSDFFPAIYSLKVLLWATFEFPQLTLSEEMLEDICQGSEDLAVVKWVAEVKNIPLNSSMFCAACGNSADNVQLVQWLSLKVKPPPSDEVLFNSLITALTRNNTAVASWLDAHFHIMERATSTSKGIESKAAGSILVRVCKTHLDERGDGVKWLLNHPSMAHVEESLVVQAVRYLVLKTRLSTLPLFIIEKLPISEPLRNELLTGVMLTTIQRDTLTQVQKVISMGELNKEAVAKCLTSTDKDQCIHVSSSKVVKWLITNFQLDRDHITLNNNALLLNLLSHHHSSCAEWLINMFRITFEEVLSLNITAFSEADLATWQMMLRVFPQITAPTIKQKLMCLACQSPVTAQYTMRMFPEITTADVVEFWSTQSPYSVPLFVRLWLGAAIP